MHHSQDNEKFESPVIARGQGEPVILIHGSGAASAEQVWQLQQPLAKDHRLFLPTRTGYGNRPARAYREIEPDIREIAALLENVGEAHLVGLSYGGIVAMLASLRHPEKVRSLTVLEPPAFTVASEHAAVAMLVAKLRPVYAATLTQTPEAFLKDFLFAFTGERWPEDMALPPDVRKGIEASMAETPPFEIEIPVQQLAATSFPKLVVSGNWHPAMEAISDTLVQGLNAQRAVCEGAGHVIPETGDALNQLLTSFWKNNLEII